MFIDTIDGVVVVVESFADAKAIAPQVHFHRLQTQVLGNNAWWDPEAIRPDASGRAQEFRRGHFRFLAAGRICG